MAERKPNRPFTASSRRISQNTDQLARLKSAKGHLSEMGPASETWVSPSRADSRSASRASESCPQQQAKFSEPEATFCPVTSAFADEKLYARAPLTSRVAMLSCKKVNDERDIPPIQTLGYNLQEYALIEDVLYVMMGIEGRYITQADAPPTKPGDFDRPPSFQPVDGIDASLRELVLRILPLASFHSQISRFVLERSKFEYGLVNHALCSALRELQKEYLLLIAQLEYQFRSNVTFTLQKLWFYVHTAVKTMSILADLTTELEAVAAADKEEDAMMEISRSDIDESDATKISLASKGGSVLTVISRRMAKLSGDLTAKRLHAYLLSKASVPYFSLLRSWIRHGIIRDPCLEFMVEEHQNVRKENLGQDYNDAYWEMRYTLRDGYVPPFLEPLKHQILLAGKYLNVIQGCGLALPPAAATAIAQERRDGPDVAIRDVLVGKMEGVDVDESRYVADVEYAYRTANQALLTLLVKDQQLLSRLRSLKHYFLLDQSDFFTHLMSTASEELAKKYRQVSLTKLQSLLELVLRNPASVAFSDPFKEDLKVEMSTTGLVDQLLKINSMAGLGVDTAATKMDMLPLEAGLKFSGEIAAVASTNEGLTGIEALTFDYMVDFPLSLVISRKSLTKYQLLFRLIVLFKHAESLLSQAWLEHAKARTWRRGELSDDVHRWRKRVFGLRGQMLNFVQQLAYYVCFEVLEPKWRELEEGLGKVTTVDQLLQTHSDFLDTCLKECMLTNSKLLTIFNHVMNVCIVFPKYTDWLRSALEATGSESVSPAAEKALAKFEHGFSKYSRLLVDALSFYSSTETSQFLCLVTRLDFNHYYTQQDAL